MKKPLESKEAKFLIEVFEAQDPPEHPLLKILFGQLQKLSTLIDNKEERQRAVKKIFDYIKEHWD